MASAAKRAPLPKGWRVKESKSRPGVMYYVSPSGKSQWTPPTAAQAEAGRGRKRKRSDGASASAADKDDRVRASHILVKHAGSRKPRTWQEEKVTRTLPEARDKLVGIRKRVLELAQKKAPKGSTPLAEQEALWEAFTEVAREESGCSSHDKGGDLGFFTRRTMHAQFSDAAFALEPHTMSDIVESPSGVHIILRTDDPSLPARITCSHILKKHKMSRRPFSWRDPDTAVTRSKEEAEEELRSLRENLVELEGEELTMTFQDLARDESECKSAKHGGDLGAMEPGKMFRSFDQVAFRLPVGGLSDVAETPSGFHLILRTA